MFSTGIKTILASTLVAATMLGASAPLANAGNFEVNIGLGGSNGFSIQSIDYKHGHKNKNWKRGRHGKHHGRGGYGKHGRHGGYGKHSGRGGHGGNYGCSPRRAVNKAWNMGLNHPHVKRVGRRNIVVNGRYHGSRAKIVFSRYGRCHVVNFERNYW